MKRRLCQSSGKNMRSLQYLFITWLGFASITYQIPVCAFELDYIVAVVDEDVVTNTELQIELKKITAQLQTKGVELPQKELLERQILERMIIEKLQLQTAQQAGIQIDDATLDRAINSIATKNNLSLSQLRDTVEQEGANFTDFRENTRQQVQILRLQAQEVVNKVNVTEQEVEQFLHRNQLQNAGREAVQLQHILVSIPDGSNPSVMQQAQEKVERLMQQLRSGTDFAKLALIFSDGRQALDGGDLGWMPLSQVPAIAADIARNLSPGSISEPIRNASGIHIFKLVAVKNSGERQIVTQTHAQHILIKTNELISDQEAETRLAQLRMRIIGGESFATLARSHSNDTASAIKGGDLGWINPGDTVPEFEAQMKTLALNEISQPFRSAFGWHLLQVLERRQHDSTEDALKTKARENLRARKVEEALDLWLRRLRDESYVEIRLHQSQDDIL
jgi:peptidyl-prolyl cis-trans isomerase SurA